VANQQPKGVKEAKKNVVN
jgi:hypothetical protein